MEILEMGICELVSAQVSGELTAVQILEEYKRRAADLHSAANCLTCWVPEAEAWAAHCDAFLAEWGRPIGNLHGVPCTIKDHYAVRGLPVTMGLKSLRDRAEKSGGVQHDAVAVLALRAAGAVPFAKTTMTQLGNTWGGGSPAYGDTLNVHNTLRTSGGSSSGEGTVVGGAGSVFGIGSDVGGSVRCPGAFSGIAAFKPTAARFSFAWEDGRTILNHPGDYGIPATGGPLARKVSDLIEVCRAVWSPESPMLSIDTRVPPLPFDDRALAQTRPLRIGFFVEGGYTHPSPCPAVVRVVARAAAALRSAGHKLVPFDPNSEDVAPWSKIHPIIMGLVGAGPPEKEQSRGASKRGNYESSRSAADDVHPDLASMYKASFGPSPLLPKPRSSAGYQKLVAQRDRLRDSFSQSSLRFAFSVRRCPPLAHLTLVRSQPIAGRAWRAERLDALLCPAWAFPAPPVHEVRHLPQAVWSTQVYNFLDVPAGVVPAGHVTREDLAQPWTSLEASSGGSPLQGHAEFAAACLRSRQGSEGMPLAVQLVGAPWREEALLKAMLETERALATFPGGEDLPARSTKQHELVPVPRRAPKMGAIPVAVNTVARL